MRKKSNRSQDLDGCQKYFLPRFMPLCIWQNRFKIISLSPFKNMIGWVDSIAVPLFMNSDTAATTPLSKQGADAEFSLGSWKCLFWIMWIMRPQCCLCFSFSGGGKVQSLCFWCHIKRQVWLSNELDSPPIVTFFLPWTWEKIRVKSVRRVWKDQLECQRPWPVGQIAVKWHEKSSPATPLLRDLRTCCHLLIFTVCWIFKTNQFYVDLDFDIFIYGV